MSHEAWYVSAENRFGGPFSTESIQMALCSGDLDHRTLVWQAQRHSWQKVSEVELFNDCLPEFVQTPSVEKFFRENEFQLQRFDFHNDTPINFTASQDLSNILRQKAELAATSVTDLAAASHTPQTVPEKTIEKDVARLKSGAGRLGSRMPHFWLKNHPRTSICVLACALLGVGAIVYSLLKPNIMSDLKVTHLDRFALQKVATMKLEDVGPKATFVTSKADNLTPVFYVGTNLPDDEVLQFHLNPIAETLVGPSPIDLLTKITVKDHLAVTPMLRDSEGVPYPKGKYKVQIESALYGTLIKDLIVFIGGSEDHTYKQQLGAYQTRAKVQARNELYEIKQIVGSLKTQIQESGAQYRKLREAPISSSWTEFSKAWSEFHHELHALTRDWASSNGIKRRHYKTLATTTFEVVGLIESIHGLQDSLLKKKENDKGDLSQATATALKILDSTLEQVDSHLAKLKDPSTILPSEAFQSQ